ncbi:cobalamin biosynthesis protein [Rhizobium sp. FY34]|uniref:cobalamin biosynthesis protein n=1 Tax=Rhizobium sp. FY34 TaxID=2562309 RepID=UPI0010C0B424|nr:cobalamin biosynthesis protein [Rhizobium sp. FY34]
MIAAGIGCRKGTSAETVLAVIDEALAACGHAGSRPQILATGELKAEEDGLLEAAKRLGVDLIVVSDMDMEDVSPRTLTLSPHSMAHVGIPSFCEAAVLAAAGTNARLVGPRHVAQGVTCAIAISGEAA